MPVIALPTPSVAPRCDSPECHGTELHGPEHHRPKYGRRGHHPASVSALLEQAQQGLHDAEYAAHPVDRYAQAHLAALRAAAAVLAARARPRRRAQPTSAWVLLARLAPEFAEWSRFFAASSATRAAAEAGARHLVTTRDADDLIRQAGEFLVLARQAARTSP